MIRILQIVGTMDMGGAETLIMNIYRNIDRTKVQFDFLCHNRTESKYAEEITKLGGRMYSVPGISHVGPLKYQKLLYEFFTSHPEYKVVHSHQNELSGIIMKQAKRAGIPHRYAHSHIVFQSKKLLKRMEWKFFQQYFNANVTDAFACSYKAGESLFTGKLKENFTFVPNVTDTEKMRFSMEKRERIRKEFGIKNEIVFGHVGRFANQKNHRFLVEIFAEFLKIQPDAKLILIGQGTLKTAVEKQIADLHIEDKVILTGSRSDIPDCLCAMDLFLFPSFYEGLSVACIEAQAAGLPLLTSTSVSDEVVITELAKQYALDKTAKEWAAAAMEMVKASSLKQRSIYADKVRAAGFDVNDLAKKMQELYTNAYNS